ncbi:GGDEF domain-containing protein [Solicola sp. PLA-1-18]|uniref:GGDEF domain-containing protein n=1 Tax=Solicola sp. PLA-1-18 TaxID=3380532 RepID=UPI003B818357
MLTGLGVRTTRWTAARVLGTGYLVGGLLCLLSVLFPYADRALAVAPALGVLGIGAGLFGILGGDRVRPAVVTAGVYLAVALVCLIVHLARTESGQVLNAGALTWLGLFAAWFWTRREMLTLLTTASALLALAMATSAFAFRPTGFAVVVAHVAMMTLLLHHLVRDARLDTDHDHDQLTGLLVRTTFLRRAADAMTSARRSGEDLVLVLVDLDGFKAVNDSHGHAEGDRLLADVAARWRSALGPDHLAGRLGGDEFAFLLRRTDLPGSATVVGRMVLASGHTRWPHGATAWEREPLAAWLDRTDRALYAHKRSRHADLGEAGGDPS